jgi:hypothetical protein
MSTEYGALFKKNNMLPWSVLPLEATLPYSHFERKKYLYVHSLFGIKMRSKVAVLSLDFKS